MTAERQPNQSEKTDIPDRLKLERLRNALRERDRNVPK